MKNVTIILPLPSFTLALFLLILSLLPSALLRAQSPAVDDFNPGPNGAVYSLAVQGEGEILVGGYFGRLGGQPRSSIGRVHDNGTVDTTFELRGASPLFYVYALATQPDGKVLMGGTFWMLGGQLHRSLARLNTNGTPDASFNSGSDGAVNSLALQADGKILVGGTFTNLCDQPRRRIGRLNADGTLDTSFNPGTDGTVYSVAEQADGKILVGGAFTNLCGQTRRLLGRLNADGTLDASFNPGAGGTSAYIGSLMVQADGKILVGGYFDMLGGQTRSNIARINVDGTLDASFNPGTGGNSAYVASLVAQADGKILVGGSFTNLCGQTRKRIGRLNADGTLDPSFNPEASAIAAFVGSLAVQTNGKILVGGFFTALGGQPRSGVGRLNNTEPATQNLTSGGSIITWLRGGTSPEVWRTTFEHSPDGSNWTHLGDGVRIPGGWQLTNVVVPPANTIRARGFVSGSGVNAWFVESQISAPSPLRLSLAREGLQVWLSWTGGLGPYQVQQTSHLESPTSWQDVGTPLATNSISLPLGPTNRFLRVRGQ